MTKTILSLFARKKNTAPEADDAKASAQAAMNLRMQRMLDAAPAKNA